MRPTPLSRTARHVLEAALAVLAVTALWRLPDRHYTWFVTEDGALEWLQVAALAVVLVVAVRQLPATRRWSVPFVVWGAVAAVMVVAIGEELAWGTRLFRLTLPSIQQANVQGDVTLHNLGGMRGLSKTFGAIALVGLAGAVAVVRRRPGLAVWFALPAIYAAVRVLDNTPITSRFAKLSEILELVLYVALARWALTADAPVAATSPAPGSSPSPASPCPLPRA
jgi:hypothetical protein